MKIETQFKVHDLVQYKFQRNPITGADYKSVSCFEVMEVFTQTCYGGTQVFYHLRPIHGTKDLDFVDGKKVIKFIDFSPGFLPDKEDRYIRMREDEIKAASQDIVDLVCGSKVG